MQFIDLVKKRCSIRSFSSQTVEAEKLHYILEAARLAPSAVNYQPWYFVVIESDEGKKKIQACYERTWLQSAPLYIIVCGDHNTGWKRGADGKDHTDIDVSIAIEHICLAAAELGLGTCWVCNFDTTKCIQSFHIPESIEPIAIIPIGYPAESDLFDKTPKKRKSMEEVVIREHF